MNAVADTNRALRTSVYGLLITVATGAMVGRIMAVTSVDAIGLEGHLHREGRKDWQRQRPFLSANDRSRWATVRSLVEHGTFEIDQIVSQRGWDTIDMVKHRGRDGQDHLYSSKPPLLTIVMTAPYWLIYNTTGASLGDYPFEIGRALLVLYNVLPMIAYLVILAWLAERLGMTDYARLFLVAAAAFGTFLTTFAVTANNHTPAALCVAVVLYAFVRIVMDGESRPAWFALTGFFAAFSVACELPALSLCVLLGGVLLWKAPRPTLIGYVPAALVVGIAAVGTNYLAHDSLRPPYMHRSVNDPADNWYNYTYERDGRVRESYWRNPVGVDRGEPSMAEYAFHATLGHHGVFSLTPIWLLSIWGLAIWTRDPARRELALGIALLSVVCLAFYLTRPQMDRNYGGMTSGFRWMFWFAPLWLVALLPAVDRLARSRAGRSLALILLAASVMSASYPTWNPWTHPWLWNFLQAFGSDV